MNSSVFTKSTNTEKQSPVFTVPSLFTILSSNGTRLSNISRQLRKTYESNPDILNPVNELYSNLNIKDNPEVINNLIDVYKAYLGSTNIDSISSEDIPLNHTEFKAIVVYPLIAMMVQVWNGYCYEFKTNEQTHANIDVGSVFFRDFMVNDLTNLIATLFNINDEYGGTLMKQLEYVNYIAGNIIVKGNKIELYPLDAEHLINLLNVSVGKDILQMYDYRDGKTPEIEIISMDDTISHRFASLWNESKEAVFTFDETKTIALAVKSEDFSSLVKLCTGKSTFYIRNMLLLVWHLITLKRDAEE